MTNPIYKISSFTKHDGYLNTLRYVINILKNYFFIRTSYTFFFENKIECKFAVEKPLDLDFEIITNYNLFSSFKNDRFSYYHSKEWFDNGSICCICKSDGNPISCIWAHVNSYEIEKVGEFRIKENEAWIGPTFVDIKFRRKGINTLQRKYLINYLIESNRLSFITSVNLQNFPAISNAFRQGYNVIGIYKVTTIFNKTISRSQFGSFLEMRLVLITQ